MRANDVLFCPDRFRIAALALVGPYIAAAVVAEKRMIPNMPAAGTETGHSLVDIAMTGTLQSWSATVMWGTLLRKAWHCHAKESTGASRRPTLNVANTRAAPTRATGGPLRRARPNADSDIEVHSYSCIAADNRRRHMQMGATGVLPRVPPHVARLP